MAEARRAGRAWRLSGHRGRDDVPFSDPLDTFEITLDESAPPGDGDRPEPTLAAAPFFVEFDEPIRLDPKRIGLTWELPPAARPGLRLRSSFGSLAMHLLPLLLIVLWPTATNEGPSVIPVQLVIEEPPPPPPQPAPQPPPPPPPQTGRLASVDTGDVKPKTPGTAPAEAPPAAGEKQPDPSETKTATAATPPPVAPPKPVPPKEPTPAVHPPKPSGAELPKHEATPHEAPHAARFAGPAASRDEYLAYLVSLTRQHIDLLPMSVVGTRRGETVISVTVLDNGTIAHIGVSQSSGYPDIDKRIALMVAAVGKFPPVPQWFQGNQVQLELTLRFPEALER